MATFQKRCGRWRALIRRSGHPALSKTFQTKLLAEQWAREQEAAIGREDLLPSYEIAKRTTVGLAIRRYFDEGLSSPRGDKPRRYHLGKIAETLGKISLHALLPTDIIRHAKTRAAGGCGPTTVKMELMYFGDVLNVAAKIWGIPMREVLPPARLQLRKMGLIGVSRQRTRRPTPDELTRLAAFWTSPEANTALPMQDIMGFLIASCMRVGEVCAIRWVDLDAKKRLALIRARKHPQDKESNDQWIPLLGDAWEIIQRQPKNEDHPFPFLPESIGAAWRRACVELGIEDLRVHDLRHEGISRLFERGYQVQQVALVSGHRSWDMLKRYTQIRPESLHRDLPPEPTAANVVPMRRKTPAP